MGWGNGMERIRNGNGGGMNENGWDSEMDWAASTSGLQKNGSGILVDGDASDSRIAQK